jgi:outer membrane autotransporter protein
LTNVLESVVTTVDGGAQVAALSVGGQVQGIVDQRMAAVHMGGGLTGMAAGASANGATMWLQGYGQAAEQDLRDDIAGYEADTWGGAVGVDTTKLISNGVIGLAFNYGNTEVDSDNVNTTSTDVDNYGVTLYSNVDLGQQMFFNGQIGYAYNDIEIVRHDVGGAGLASANGDTDSSQYSARLALGRDYAAGNGAILTPVVSAAYTHLETEGYTETGSLADLTVADEDADVFNLGVAVNAGWNLKNSDGSTTKPSVHVGYTYDAVGDRVQTTSSFAGDPAAATFVTQGADPARSTFNAGAGITWMTTANWDLSAAYDYQAKEDFDAHNGMVRATAQF